MLSRAVENFNRKISALTPVNISARIILKLFNPFLIMEINPIDLGNMKFELENDTQKGHCSM